jgi:glycosyltransferase involved in cell wall biosynthesis
MKKITIIIATRDRPAALRRCLSAIASQQAVGPLEILVVDDGSVARDAIAAVVAAHPPAKLLRTTGVGLGAARNVGIAAAAGDILLFTDDDCQPNPEWADELANRLRQGADAVGGATVPAAPVTKYRRASEAICAFVRDRLSFLVGNNMGCRREVASMVPFSETSPVAAGEDREWSERLRRQGFTIVYEPKAVVQHAPDLNLRRYWAQHLRYGRAAIWLCRQEANQPRQDPAFYLGLVGTCFRHGAAVGVLACFAQFATLIGALTEWLAFRSRASHG